VKNFQIGHLVCIEVERMILTKINDTDKTWRTNDSERTKWLRKSLKASRVPKIAKITFCPP